MSEIMLEVSASVVIRKFHTSLRPYQYIVYLLNSLRWVLQALAVTHETFRKPMFPQSLSHFAINQYVCSKNKCKFSLKFLKYSGIQEKYEKGLQHFIAFMNLFFSFGKGLLFSLVRHYSNVKCVTSQNLKLVSAIFYQIFIFSPNDSPSKTMKNVFYFI